MRYFDHELSPAQGIQTVLAFFPPFQPYKTTLKQIVAIYSLPRSAVTLFNDSCRSVAPLGVLQTQNATTFFCVHNFDSNQVNYDAFMASTCMGETVVANGTLGTMS